MSPERPFWFEGSWFAVWSRGPVDVHGGKHHGELNEKAILGEGTANTDSAMHIVSTLTRMSLVLRCSQGDLDLPSPKTEIAHREGFSVPALLLGQIPLGPKAEGVRVDRLIMVHRPHVRVNSRSFGDEHALVNIVDDGRVGDAKWRQGVHPVSFL